VSFISSYLAHTQQYESPTSFWKWSAYATIAAVVRDNVFRRQGESYLFPNMYVLLMADSSVHRKGRPVDTAEILISAINNTKLISGSTSIQALVDELGRVETDIKTGKLMRSGSGIFLAQELSAALVEDPRAIKILTDIYDYKPQGYTIRLISRSNGKVDKLVLNMLAASNEALLKSLYNDTAIYGGLLARTFLVLPDEFRPSNSLWAQPDPESFKCIKDLLREISTMKGEVQFEKAAEEEYDNWYIPFRNSYKNKNEKSGVVGRIHTSVLKLAMVLAVNDMTLIIGKQHIEEAISEAMKLIPNYKAFLMTTGASKNKDEIGAFIINTMMNAADFTISRRVLLQQPILLQPEGAELLEKMMITMEAGGLVTQMISSDIREGVSYKLTPKCIELMKG
jgi:hypothetical protein